MGLEIEQATNWKLEAIGEHIDLLTGFPFSSAEYSNNGIRLLRGSNIKRGNTDWKSDITKYWKRVDSSLKPYLLEEGDIVIAMDGSLVGRSFAQLSKEDVPALLLQRVARVRSSVIDQNYLKELICSELFTKHCDMVKTSSAIPHISPADILSYTIPIPPTTEEQQAIAKVLSDTDKLIQTLEKKIEKKKLIKKGTMQKLLMPKYDWEEVVLSDVITVQRGGSPRPIQEYLTSSPEGVNWIKIGDTHPTSKYIVSSQEKIIDSGVANSRQVYQGDFLLSNSMSFGRPYILKIDGCIHDGWLVLQNYQSNFDTDFLYYLLTSEHVFNQYLSKAAGSGVLNLNKEVVRTVMLLKPSIKEQQSIAVVLNAMDNELEGLETSLKKYRILKQALMQQLLTGKIRLV